MSDRSDLAANGPETAWTRCDRCHTALMGALGGASDIPWEGNTAMRKHLAPALAGIGFFLLVAGIIASVWAPGVVKKTPLKVDTTTLLSGEAAKIDTSGRMITKPIYAENRTMVDSSVSDDSTVVWSQRSCVAFGTEGRCFDQRNPNRIVVPTDELVTGSSLVFGSDRVTAEGVGTKRLPQKVQDAGGVATKGLINKWPFDTAKRDYTYWDSTIGEELPATFERTARVDGLQTYVFQVQAEKVAIDVAPNTPGVYSSTKEIYVEPATGSIINQTEQQERWLADGTKVLDLSVGFTKGQISANVKDAEANRSSIALITRVVPLVGFIGGGALLVAAALLVVRRRSRDRAAGADRRALVDA